MAALFVFILHSGDTEDALLEKTDDDSGRRGIWDDVKYKRCKMFVSPIIAASQREHYTIEQEQLSQYSLGTRNPSICPFVYQKNSYCFHFHYYLLA